MNVQKDFSPRGMNKAFRLTFMILTATAFAVFAFLAVDSTASTQAAQQQKTAPNPNDEQATPEMLAYALNFKSAAGYKTLASDSEDANVNSKKDLYEAFSAVRQLPCTKIDDRQLGGKAFAPGVYCFDFAELNGQMTLDAENDAAAKFVFLIRGDLEAKTGSIVSLTNGAQAANAFFVADDSINIGEAVEFQGNLVAKNNVRADASSALKGRIFSVAGKIEAAPENNLGGGTGTVQLCKTVSNAAGTDISNRIYRFTISGVAGIVEVFVPPTPAGPATSQGCSAPLDVPAGPQTITELGTARLSTGPGTFENSPGTFTNFQLINVEQLSPTPQTGASSLGVVNLATRAAFINVIEGGSANTLIVKFTNVFAITGFIEICKQRANGPTLATPAFGFPAQTFNPPNPGTNVPSGGDPNVNGFFNFTVENVYALNQIINAPGSPPAIVRAYQIFTVPVGGCSGVIAVTINSPPTTTAPRESSVRVTELARVGFFLESVSTRPSFDRELRDFLNSASLPVNGTNGAGGEVLGSRIVPPTDIVTGTTPNAPRGSVNPDNVGGGYATVRVIESAAASETIVDFYNRSNPGTIKICKIAGPGIPVGTLFRFSVFASFGTTGFTEQQGTSIIPNSPQFATFGEITKIVDVQAGNPATGGNCVTVPGIGAGTLAAQVQTFVNGTPVLIVENGIAPNNETMVPAGAIRASRVRALGPSTGTTLLPGGTAPGTAGFSPNPDLQPAPAGYDGRIAANTDPADNPRIARVAVNQRPGEAVAEFANFVFNPTLLRICKIAGEGIAPNTRSFGFSITLTDGGAPGLGGSLFPGNPTANVSAVAGATSQTSPFGSCTIVDGSAFPGGAFNVGSDVTITENAGTAGTVVTSIVSPTNSSGLIVDLTRRTARFSGLQTASATSNTVVYTNATSGDPARRTKFDFDGDGKADPAIYRASTGTFVYAASSANYEMRSIRWGAAGDKPVPADYDGDRRTDAAVYRRGDWFVLSTTEGFRSFRFGLPDDLPQPNDYDGDGRDDIAVFRPSDSFWYLNRSRDGFSAIQFGISTDKPVPADYDGDGKTDIAVYRSGIWYLNRSLDGFTGVAWGTATDRPVPADYDGNGTADLAVFRNGVWFILSLNPNTFNAVNWGLAGDVPVPADYDGDGRDNVAVYRNGEWFIRTSSQTFLRVSLGSSGDVPVTGVLP